MSKSAIVAKLREKGLSTAQADAEINRVFAAVSAAIQDEQPVRVPGFGTFKRKFRDSATRRNPRTGESITTQPKHVITFKEAKKPR